MFVHCLQSIDKQSLLDSGIFCCLVHILNALLGSDGGNVRQNVVTVEEEPEVTENVAPDRRLEVGHLLLFYTPSFIYTNRLYNGPCSMPVLVLLGYGLATIVKI